MKKTRRLLIGWLQN